ncbi:MULTISPECIES: hypothetical protein [unclassified Leifsonia]|uniref:hypothetical protein n=1 Tax=unclassified Leifsonia TaxID=2663824 RepID=UPI0006F6B2C0|nr:MULTISPECIES: hypothetical protein [unclassified Leifsonia]KQX05674.1 hypothetical protein ASC59_16515 [Leifsonia sp. Root1293]KRA09310.1 hypothetical protein ASD61_16510 [Leifsonia sp. Root60]
MATIAIISPATETRVSGTVNVVAKITGGTKVSGVTIIVGVPEFGTREAKGVGGGKYYIAWNTTRKLVDNVTPTPSDGVFWIRARAVVDGVTITSPFIGVATANRFQNDALPTGGWRSELAWAAKYDGTLEQWKAGHGAVVGAKYVQLVNDPILGSARKVAKISVPESARYDADQPTKTTVRFQSSSRRNIVEGDEFCVGFAFMPPADFPTVYPKSDPANPNGPDATGYIALFQFYGPPYVQGSPLVLHADRRLASDPLDEFVVRGNELNAGDPWPYLSLPYRRGRWTDVVLRIHVSRSISKGWIETYVNQGAATSVQPVPFVNGAHRVPRVLARPDSEAFRTDMQIYRVANRFPVVSMYQTGHRIARTVAEADPRSYRNGAKP